MFAAVLKLRRAGRRLSHSVDERARIAPELLVTGILEVATAHEFGLRGRHLLVRATMAAPGSGLLAALYEPRITGTTLDAIQVRGLEQVGDSVYLQEWAVYVIP